MAETPHWRQVAVYLAGGVGCALLDIGVMQLLLWSGMHYAPAASAGFVTGLVVNYAFHGQLTFGRAASLGSFLRYLSVAGMNYLLTLGCVALAAQLLDAPLAGKILSLPLVAANGFLLGKHWIYR